MESLTRPALEPFNELDMPRLRACHWHPDLAAEALRIYGDPVAMRFLRPTYPLDDVDAMHQTIEQVIARNAQYDRRMGSWPLFEKQTDRLVGTVILKPLPDDTKVEVGWHVARDDWGRGFATEAGRAAIVYGFSGLGLERIFAIVDPDNTPSVRVTQRLGMTHLGRTEAYYSRSLEYFRIERTPMP